MDTSEAATQLLTIKEVMHRLQVSRVTIYSLRKEGKISAVIVGGTVRFTESEVARFIKESSESHS